MPTLIAATLMSSKTAWICLVTISTGISWKAVTAWVF